MKNKNAAEMTVAEFERHLAEARHRLFYFTSPPPGKNNRSYVPHKKGQLFFSSGVKLAMQRRRTK